ncbi:MAG: patatin-like phospholipase family protein [Porticoccaceae bacterium]
MTTALVLTGGGARVAYQVGVLKGIASILPRTVYNPFPIITGTSAGAINAMSIAGRPGPFRLRVRKLETIWRNLHAEDIYRTDFRGVSANTLRVLTSLFGTNQNGKSVSFLDNSPLRQLLNNYVKFKHIDTAIENRELQGIAITAINYASGRSVTFYQGHDGLEDWSRARREGISTDIGIEHLMASAAIPSLFPAVEIDGNYYGDGALRQLKPISPALHLGAKKIVTIGVSHRTSTDSSKNQPPPSIAGIIGHMLNSAFTDAMESDLETLHSINKLASALHSTQHSDTDLTPFSPIDVLSIAPSESINKIASQYLQELPRSLRVLLTSMSGGGDSGETSAASYLLFEPSFCTHLIKLGYRDARDQSMRIRAFFDH